MKTLTCDTPNCDACNNPKDMNWRRAMGVMENRYIENGCKLGNYEYKLENVASDSCRGDRP
jgi:hypothetical protein